MRWIYTIVFSLLSFIVVVFGVGISLRNFIYAKNIKSATEKMNKEIESLTQKIDTLSLKEEIDSLRAELKSISDIPLKDDEKLAELMACRRCEINLGEYREELLKEREFTISYKGEFTDFDIYMEHLLSRLKWLEIDSIFIHLGKTIKIYGKLYSPLSQPVH